MTALAIHTDPTPAPPFAMATYIRTLDGQALEDQRALMTAYDTACRALGGPNDVQQEGGREFKKKSFWRKLARYFNITVEARPEDVRLDMLPSGEWVAIASATGIAPWGQRFSDFGACGSDEESGRRTISYADAIATAMTRASNRVISNLIAMGEVSAEEIDRRVPVARRAPAAKRETRPAPTPEPTNGTVPLALHDAEAIIVKGTALGDMKDSQVERLRDWARGVIEKEGESDRMVRIANACSTILDYRKQQADTSSESEQGYLGELPDNA